VREREKKKKEKREKRTRLILTPNIYKFFPQLLRSFYFVEKNIRADRTTSFHHQINYYVIYLSHEMTMKQSKRFNQT
jgi:pantothenate kinase